MKILGLILFSCLSYCSPFIIPNELPTILSVVYSNIPPLKIGLDTRFGFGFRLGPHADFQTLIEIGPQTNTNPISTNGTLAKRNSLPLGRLNRFNYELFKRTDAPTTPKEPPKKKPVKEKKIQKTIVGNIEFKKVPGIDEDTRKSAPKIFYSKVST